MHINARMDIDMVAVERDDLLTVMLELAAPEATSTTRVPQAAVVVLDRSGSMSGDRLNAAKSALSNLVNRFADEDVFGLVTFDSQAEVVVPAGRVADLGRAGMSAAIDAIHTGGSTDLSSGYLRGLQEARRVCGDTGATIIVLSDGMANHGIVDAGRFREIAAAAAAQGITTSSIGIGVGYDDEILTEMAIGGTGNHTFAADGDAAAAAVAGEIDGLLTKRVQVASLRIRVTDACKRVQALNDLPWHGQPDGVIVELGDFYSGEKRSLLFGFELPAMPALGLAQVAEFELTYVAIPELETFTVTLPISVNVVPQDVARGRVPDAEVRRTKLIVEGQHAKKTGERALRRGDVEGAREALTSARDALQAEASRTPHQDLEDEIDFLNDALDDLDGQGYEYTSRALSSDRVKKARGYTTRAQGGRLDSGDDRCPDCGGPLVPIVSGLPSTEMFHAAERDEIILGGCDPRSGQDEFGMAAKGCPACRRASIERFFESLGGQPSGDSSASS